MKSPKVTLDQWRTLQAVIDYGGFAQAAEQLHRSQSSVSYAVNRLQKLLGIKLLHIEGRKAVISDAGKVLLQRSRQLLADASAIEQQARHLEEGWEVEIRLATEVAFPAQHLMKALKQFAKHCNKTRVRLQEVVLSGAEDALLNNAAELVIAPYVPKGFLGSELTRVNFIAVAHPDHALHQLNRPLNIQDLNRETHVMISDSGSKGIDAGWLSDSQRWAVNSLESARKMICSGLGFGWLPESEIKMELSKNKLKPLQLVEGAQHTAILFLVYADINQAGPATRQLADILKTVCEKS
ncbi:Transcriptional regulator, LysR family [hydrothermal vent metagenome]|uniref:Transcriptional regulator, LysR family n=1 Tax=hydrothermal vent metagenome TaxID=652676 RepID=A0A3B0YF28_9ZZZZ